MQITITINTDNAAFDDEPGYEVARILRQVIRELERDTLGIHCTPSPAPIELRDLNGNTCGKMEITE